MTISDDEVETELRAVFRSQAVTIAPPIEPYQEVRRRERRRYAVAGSAAAVTLVLAGTVAAGLAVLPGDRAARHPSGAAAGRAGTPVPIVSSTRGSLAGDRALLSEAARVALDTAFIDGKEVDPSTLRVPYAERGQGPTSGAIVVLVVAHGLHEQYEAAYVGKATGDDHALSLLGGASIHGGQLLPDSRGQGEEYVGDPHVLTAVRAGDQDYGVALFPPGSRATIASPGALRADCAVDPGQPRTLPLTDGAALFPLGAGTNPTVTVTDRAGHQVLRRPVGGANGTGVVRPIDSAQAVTQVSSSIGGNAAAADVTAAAGFAPAGAQAIPIAERPVRYLGVWGGRQPDGPGSVVLIGARYASGAVVLNGWETERNGQGYTGFIINGCVPAAGWDSFMFVGPTFRDTPGEPLLLVGPAAATRATVDFGSAGTLDVPLVDHGALLPAHPMQDTATATFYDRDGHPLGSVRADRPRFHDLPR
jgi:hypothetical protein